MKLKDKFNVEIVNKSRTMYVDNGVKKIWTDVRGKLEKCIWKNGNSYLDYQFYKKSWREQLQWPN